MNYEERIATLKAKVKALEAKKKKQSKLVPTGFVDFIVKDIKGNIIHKASGFREDDAIRVYRAFYRTVVRKLKQKVSFNIEKQYKKQA